MTVLSPSSLELSWASISATNTTSLKSRADFKILRKTSDWLLLPYLLPHTPAPMASAWPGNKVTMSLPSKRIECPRCLQRDCHVVDGHRSVCGLCSKSLRRVYQFCWACRREWPRAGSQCLGSACPLPGCAKRASLLSGETILDPSSAAFRCPFFRACPSCKALLTHNGVGCRYITCPDCSTEFCFRCLHQECSLEEEEDDESYLSDYDDEDDDVELCVIVDNSAAVANI
ncbi:hypothetical protein ACEWY4_009625 [Coilia grayii]|uniref:RBR-type E3 ubiquitin transferase n=1 Tax=Coilia grayii TaxID=363190 RepID=A0ABD1K775_9TELE